MKQVRKGRNRIIEINWEKLFQKKEKGKNMKKKRLVETD